MAPEAGGASMRRAARTDANHSDIVAALRAIGATVTSTAAVGSGFVDVVAGYRGVNYLLEIKDGSKPPSARKLTDDELKWHQDWRGQAHVVETVDQAIKVVTGNES